MPELTVYSALQILVALGLLNVWLVRATSQTRYRGGKSNTLGQEFTAYGLPLWFFYTIGFLKVGAALMLIAGLWFPVMVQPAIMTIAALMIGALAMHLKIRDPLIRSAPAFAMLMMCTILIAQELA
ncbi:MAG: hypothetical protein ACI9F9_001872 [Candidatus Paceibacteria bacterium]|jgi:hypothetical protein